jgi:hypothetical protein
VQLEKIRAEAAMYQAHLQAAEAALRLYRQRMDEGGDVQDNASAAGTSMASVRWRCGCNIYRLSN